MKWSFSDTNLLPWWWLEHSVEICQQRFRMLSWYLRTFCAECMHVVIICSSVNNYISNTSLCLWKSKVICIMKPALFYFANASIKPKYFSVHMKQVTIRTPILLTYLFFSLNLIVCQHSPFHIVTAKISSHWYFRGGFDVQVSETRMSNVEGN